MYLSIRLFRNNYKSLNSGVGEIIAMSQTPDIYWVWWQSTTYAIIAKFLKQFGLLTFWPILYHWLVISLSPVLRAVGFGCQSIDLLYDHVVMIMLLSGLDHVQCSFESIALVQLCVKQGWSVIFTVDLTSGLLGHLCLTLGQACVGLNLSLGEIPH